MLIDGENEHRYTSWVIGTREGRTTCKRMSVVRVRGAMRSALLCVLLAITPLYRALSGEMETLRQERMTPDEIFEFFKGLTPGKAVRLVFTNGSEYAGNFVGLGGSPSILRFRRGFRAADVVDCRRISEAHLLLDRRTSLRIVRMDPD